MGRIITMFHVEHPRPHSRSGMVINRQALMFHVEHSRDNSVNIGTALRGRVFHVEHPNGQEQFHSQDFVPRETSCICF